MKLSVLLICLLYLCTACSSSSMPVPEYPLEQDYIEDTLAQAGFPFSATELSVSRQGQKAYEFRLEDQTLAAVLSCIQGDDADSRYLSIGLPVSYFSTALEEPFEEESWRDFLVWAALLFGGFQNETAVYDSFCETFESQTEIIEQEGKVHGKWTAEIDGIHCQISYIQKTSSPDTELRALTFYCGDFSVLKNVGSETYFLQMKTHTIFQIFS